jgi:uncharacterized protein (TIGR02246 family)
MRTYIVLAGAVILAITTGLLVVCQPGEQAQVDEAPAAEPAAPAMSDEEMIQKIAGDFEAAWNAGDAQAIANLWTLDGDSIGPEGFVSNGRNEVQIRYAQGFEGVYKGTNVSITTSSIRFLQPDVAVVDGTYEITGIKDADGNDMPNIKGLFTNISVKEGDSWLITCSRPMIPVELPGTT